MRVRLRVQCVHCLVLWVFGWLGGGLIAAGVIYIHVVSLDSTSWLFWRLRWFTLSYLHRGRLFIDDGGTSECSAMGW